MDHIYTIQELGTLESFSFHLSKNGFQTFKKHVVPYCEFAPGSPLPENGRFPPFFARS